MALTPSTSYAISQVHRFVFLFERVVGSTVELSIFFCKSGSTGGLSRVVFMTFCVKKSEYGILGMLVAYDCLVC